MQEHEKLNVASYRIYLKYMGLSRNPVKAITAYNSIQDVDIRLHVSVCNSVLGCLARNGRMESALKLFDQMKCDGLLPNLVTYSTVCNLNLSLLFFTKFLFITYLCWF
jgi:pentatricopeptide repeat protein